MKSMSEREPLFSTTQDAALVGFAGYTSHFIGKPTIAAVAGTLGPHGERVRRPARIRT
jgi:hypothetical protein